MKQISKIANIQAKGTAIVKAVSRPQLISLPSRQSQYQVTALVKGTIVQPIIPAIKVKISTTLQKSIALPPSQTAIA
jgi:hypothetical protein